MSRIRILDHGVSVQVAQEWLTLLDDDAWLAVALALTPTDGLPAKVIQRTLGVEIHTGALRKRLARFQAKTGLSIHSRDVKTDKVYYLDVKDVYVDALRYLELEDEVRCNPSEDHRTAIQEARSIWKTEPPKLGGRANPVPDVYEHLHRAHAYLQSLGKRILIVDDQVGDLLAEHLNRHECKVAHDLREFNDFRSQLHQFDLAVVDLHLTTTYADATGDAIVRDINSQGLALPVIMITLRPPMNRSVPEWIKSLGLVDVILKETDEPGANMAFVAERVNALLLEDPVERACEQIGNRVHSLRRKASRRIASKLTGAARSKAVESMEVNADKISHLAGHLELAEARLEIERFVADWGE